MKSSFRPRCASFLLLGTLAWCAPAIAQQAPAPSEAPLEQPAVSGEEQPAVETSAPAGKEPKIGIDVVGERESPIGLIITPWKDSGAESELERPARLLQEDMTAVDERVFIRNLEYYEALTGALKTRKAVTPAMPSGPQATPSAGTPTSAPAAKP